MPATRPVVFVTALAMVFCVSAGCATDPAPADLDGLARWFWLHYDEGEDEAIRAAADRLDVAMGGLEDEIQSSLSVLTGTDTDHVVSTGRTDLSKAKGFMVGRTVKCSLEQVEKLFVQLDQKTLHPSYEAFSRAYTSDEAAYFARTTPNLTWGNSYTVSTLGTSYEAIISGGVRWIPAGAGGRGPLLLFRASMPAPATFNNADDFFRQDYQVQVFYERSPGVVVHLFVFWREFRFAGLDFEDDFMITTVLDSLSKGDDEYEEACAQ